MTSFIPTLISGIITLINHNRDQIASKTGVAPGAVSKVGQALEEYLSRDERFQQLAETAMQNARQHDISTFDQTDQIINRLRSSVRPLCSFVAMGWYVFARANNIPLAAEDYAIIGGVLAFWFGFRPFEKQR